ncbi:MAG TPA: nuclear transport factor 2 family protein [Gammaproteobacteria bacterium]|nr:nuclear transport factor 2 family protein [Gammaproteobacteria bacterium]
MLKNARDFAESVFSAIDAQNSAEFVALLDPDAVFIFSNAPPVHGSSAIREAADRFFDAITALRHELDKVWHINDFIICRLSVTYTARDGRVLQLPAATIWQVTGDKITDYRVYIDNSPLFAG